MRRRIQPRRARDITGLALIVVGLAAIAGAAFAWHPAAGVAVLGAIAVAAGVLLGME